MSMPTKGKHHHLPHHHHPQHHSQPPQQHHQPQQQQQPHHTPPQHQHQLILNQPVVHSPQTYSAVVTTNTRFLNAGKSLSLSLFPHVTRKAACLSDDPRSTIRRARFILVLSDARRTRASWDTDRRNTSRERARGCPLVPSDPRRNCPTCLSVAHATPRAKSVI